MKTKYGIMNISRLKLIGFAVYSLCVIFLSSCEDFVKIDPPRTDLIKATIFTNDATANSAMLDIYYNMHRNGFASGGSRSLSFLGSLSSDEQIAYASGGLDPVTSPFYNNTLTPLNDAVNSSWSQLYSWIYKVNSVIEGLAQSSGVSESMRNQLAGEAKFIRAFSYFYLVNLWGDVPLILTTDYSANATALRIPAAQIYAQIIKDLEESRILLADDYSFSNNERVRVNKWAATALLARVFLYQGDWTNADKESTSIINKATMYSLVPALSNVFYKNSSEAIWQFKSSSASSNFPNDILTFYAFSAPPSWGALHTSFKNDFESGDNRATEWVGSITSSSGMTYYFPIKYKSFTPLTEYSTVLRLAEQYLIRAEARVHLGNVSGAREDIDAIRSRSGLSPTAADNEASLLSAVERERKFELFTEWGHRWLDLKRLNRVDAVLAVIKPEWKTEAALYPIPEFQVLNSPVTQNPGY